MASTSTHEGYPKEKPSIYPQPEPELVLVETHSTLERQITIARKAVTATYKDAHSRVQDVVDRWIGVEHAVEKRVKSIVTPEEPLTPGALYVGVATLTGSVVARNRSFFLRFTLPSALLILSMNQFLPKTSHNLSSYLSSLERAHAPALADTHEQLNKRIASTSSAAREAWVNSRHKTVAGVERAVAQLQDSTGLKLRELFGWGQGTINKVEASVKGTVDLVDKKDKDLGK